MRKFDVWDVIIWISLLVLVGYIVAKLAGWINTPDWVNILPLITLVFFSGAFYQKVLGFMDRIYNRTDYLKNSLDRVENKLEGHDRRIMSLETRRKV